MEEQICRLCLQTIGHNFKPIEKDMNEIFNVIHLKIDLSITEDPVMCTDCERNLQESYALRTTCRHSEDRIASFASNEGNGMLEWRDVDLSESERETAVSDEKYDVYQICVQFAKRDCCKSLNILKENMGLEEDVIQKCLPDMNLVCNQKPVICIPCTERLERYSKFMSACWRVEEKIREYCGVEGTTGKGKVQLRNVLKSMLIDYSKPIKVGAIKIEAESVASWEIENNDLKDELLVKFEEEDLRIKAEAETSEKQYSFDSNTAMERSLVAEQDYASSQQHVSQIATYHCAECTYKTIYKYNLATHMRTHKASPEDASYKCEKCTFKSSYKGNLKLHSLIHKDSSEIVMYKCEQCTYATKHKFTMKIHVLKHKDSKEITMYTCEECAFKTKFKHNLKQHILAHKDTSEVTVYDCKQCTYQTKFQSNLKKHVLKHKNSSEVAIYKCEECAYQTKFKGALKNHAKKHMNSTIQRDPSEIIMYKCDKCNHETKYKHHLKRHKLTHKE